MDEAIEALFASSPCDGEGSDEMGLGRLKRKSLKAFDAPEKSASEVVVLLKTFLFVVCHLGLLIASFFISVLEGKWSF